MHILFNYLLEFSVYFPLTNNTYYTQFHQNQKDKKGISVLSIFFNISQAYEKIKVFLYYKHMP